MHYSRHDHTFKLCNNYTCKSYDRLLCAANLHECYTYFTTSEIIYFLSDRREFPRVGLMHMIQNRLALTKTEKLKNKFPKLIKFNSLNSGPKYHTILSVEIWETWLDSNLFYSKLAAYLTKLIKTQRMRI